MAETRAYSNKWSSAPGCIETEPADITVYGKIPEEIDGTNVYRIMADPFYPPSPENNIPIGRDGHISASRICNGQVDMKTKYVDTERRTLEQRASRRLFGLYRNPFTHRPCIRAAVDSMANRNMVYWAHRLLALREVALPYKVDPNTLDTIKYDLFVSQVYHQNIHSTPQS